jgi:hypothetical protein
MKKIRVALLCLGLSACTAAEIDQGLGQIFQTGTGGTSSGPLSENEILGGLREALAQGTTRAINQLGHTDGFWQNLAVRVPLPESLARGEKVMRRVGLGPRLDEFHLTLNRAAERAVPDVADIFGNAVRQLTIADARSILMGADDAATQFFRRTAGATLHERVLPIVERATQGVGVTSQYKKLVANYGPVLQMAGVHDTDLDAFVTDKALDGLFLMIADEEKRIRENPVARTTEILRRVFGSRGG